MTTPRGTPRLPALALVLAGVFGATPARAAAQTLQGRVVDTSTEAPVAGATLQLLAPDSQVVVAGLSTDAGDFSLVAPAAGEFLLRIERLGYQTSVLGPLRLRAGGFLDVTVALGTAAIPVEGVNVQVEGRIRFLEVAGFYDRRQKTAGQFLDRKEIEALHLEKVSDLINTFRGVRIIRNAGEADVVLRGAVSRALSGATNCLPPIYRDGVLIATQWPPDPARRLPLDQLLAEDLEAVEVYVGQATVPAQFGSGTLDPPCGAIVLWRRR
jgi:hypothetical protein